MKPTLTACALGLLAPAALAQTLDPAPAAGLWETQYTMKINGQDLAQVMQNAMAAALKDMPPEHRAMAEQMMKQRGAAGAGGMPGMGGKRQECLTPAQAARRSQARTLLDDLQKDAPQCRYEPVQIRGGTVSFKGRCSDPEGFTGDVAGEFVMDGAKAWRGQWTGQGRMAGDIGQMPGLKVAADGRVAFGWNGNGRWVAAACGNVKPE